MRRHPFVDDLFADLDRSSDAVEHRQRCLAAEDLERAISVAEKWNLEVRSALVDALAEYREKAGL